MFYGGAYRDVVIIDYSAMNSFGGSSRSYFLAWYANDGTIAYDNEHYTPSDIRDRELLSINDITS